MYVIERWTCVMKTSSINSFQENQFSSLIVSDPLGIDWIPIGSYHILSGSFNNQ
jgi:hypothetical protein